MNNLRGEIILGGILVVLLVLFLNPFEIWMPDMATMTMVAMLLVAFGVFAAFVVKEKARDEREEIHRMRAGRIAFLSGAAVKKSAIKYPVVLDNDYSIWRAYKNNYWPRKYLVDINGRIVYDHIGEGGYEETEGKIREALNERGEKLGEKGRVSDERGVPEEIIKVEGGKVGSPEIYFGSLRNDLLANGRRGISGVQSFEEPEKVERNKLYLVGSWEIKSNTLRPCRRERKLYLDTKPKMFIWSLRP